MLRTLKDNFLWVLTLTIVLNLLPVENACGQSGSTGNVGLSTSIFALQSAADLRNPLPGDLPLADVDGDGDIDLKDAIIALRILAGIRGGEIGIDTGDIFALVSDPGGHPVPFARVGDSALTDEQGMAMGTVSATGDVWTKVSAGGYAPNYIRQIGMTVNERRLFETTLTPSNLSWNYLPGEDNPLIVGDAAAPAITISAGPGIFPPGTVLHLAMLEPVRIGPRFAPLSSGYSGYLRNAFSFEAVDENGDAAAMDLNGTISARIRDDGSSGDDPVLASFNPETATWEVVEGAAARVDDNHVAVTLPHLSFFGLFGQTPADDSGDAYQEGLSRLLNHDAPNQDQALADLAAGAREYAGNNRNEFGKHRLIVAAGAAFEQGQAELGNSLMEEAKQIVREMAARLLNVDECPKVRETLLVHEQVMLLGVSEYDQPLYDKLQEYYKKCNPWSGTVKYTFFFNDTWPQSDDADMKYSSGDRSWSETHDITFSVHPENQSLAGESNVTVKFPKVIYKNDADNNPECGDDYVNLGAWSEPCPGKLWLEFEGAYVNGVFSISPPVVRPTDPDTPVAIYHLYQAKMWGEESGACAVELN
ncbi:MAG: hypothetical protein LLG97_13925, partial [Deltaproteobacteria bacterium]|nr:hypothetical protein [Deltaproteobacteria bacterium]